MSMMPCCIKSLPATFCVLKTGQNLYPESQRPVFRHVNSLREAAYDVDAIWKFALTDEDTVKLQNFTQVVEQQLGLTCEWSWHDQVDVAQNGNNKGNRLAKWVESQGLSMSQVMAFGDNTTT